MRIIILDSGSDTSSSSFSQRSERSYKPIVTKMTKMTQRVFQWFCLIFLFGMLGWVFLTMPSNPLMFFYTPQFLQSALILIMIFFVWSWVTNRLGRFPVEIIKKVHKKRIISKPISKDDKDALLDTIASILAVPYVVMVMIFLFVAIRSGTGITVVYWNKFSEMWVELLVFGTGALFIGWNTYRQIKKFRKLKLKN